MQPSFLPHGMSHIPRGNSDGGIGHSIPVRQLIYAFSPHNRELNAFSPVSHTRFGFVRKVVPLFYVYICGGRVWDKGGRTCLQNGACCVEPEAKIVKAGFRSFRSIVDQNTLLKTSVRNRKCAQECSSGKK